MQLNLSYDHIDKIINFNLAPRFVEFCISNGIDNVYEMNDLYERYINGENLLSLINRKKK